MNGQQPTQPGNKTARGKVMKKVDDAGYKYPSIQNLKTETKERYFQCK